MGDVQYFRPRDGSFQGPRHAGTPPGGGSSSGGDDMEARVKALEDKVGTLATRADIADLRSEIHKATAEVHKADAATRAWTTTWGTAVLLSLLAIGVTTTALVLTSIGRLDTRVEASNARIDRMTDTGNARLDRVADLIQANAIDAAALKVQQPQKFTEGEPEKRE